MPYKRRGRTVWVKKDGKWQIFKAHASAEKAEAYRKALEANVKHKK
tara:strand:+ start:848 stop:985 length:138 start_codon:yes stop_codon:yes gene_type:complete